MKIIRRVNIHLRIFFVFFTAPAHLEGFTDVVSAAILVFFNYFLL
jgi:hypothetical protein